ncbi:MAG TPA: family 10 glycosylhydrolase [Nitrospiria bacterium]|nr:family 10 glycosylhydrolase [Nitrospiria bacterium]
MNFSRREFLKLAALSAGAGLWPFYDGAGSGEEMYESRAMFDESLNWITPRRAEKMCERIKRAGFNVLMPSVWHGRGTSWPSGTAPWDSDRLADIAKSDPGFDPLDNLIKTAGRYQIEVHPWFNVMLRQRDFFPQFHDPGTPELAFDVHRPEFRDFICDLMLECVSRYPVQGINLDYIRAVGISQSPYCIDDYRKETGRNLVADRMIYGVSSDARGALARWQEKAVGEIVRRVSTAVRQTGRNMVISVCANPGSPDTYIQGQDSLRWADSGLIDVLYSMEYSENPDWTRLKALKARMKRPQAMAVLCGNFGFIGSSRRAVARDGEEVARVLAQSRDVGGGNGVALYLYNLLTDDQIENLRRTTFATPARPRWNRATAAA